MLLCMLLYSKHDSCNLQEIIKVLPNHKHNIGMTFQGAFWRY